MAEKIDVNPLQAGGKIDPTNPVSALKTVVFLVLAFVVFFTAMAFGRDGAQTVQNRIASWTGVSTSENGPSIEVV
jgi:hypothetical protein